MTINEFHYIDKGPGYYVHKLTGEVWMTREQIGQALEYADPAVAIAKIHARHPDRLEKNSVCMPVERVYQVGNDPLNTGGEQDTYLYSNKGIMEICRWSRQPVYRSGLTANRQGSFFYRQ